MLTILLATCETALQAFTAADNLVDAGLVADLEKWWHGRDRNLTL
jgi:hypothetical protein